MNRTDLQKLARARLRDMRALLNSGSYDGAYYIGGYVVECGLKACIARGTRRHDFPEKKTVTESYSHKLSQLLQVAGLQRTAEDEGRRNPSFAVNWTIVKDWSEESRYQTRTRTEAEDLYRAITARSNGVLPWLRRHW